MSEQEKKKENKAYEANGTYGANRAYGAQGTNGLPQRKALEPRTFLPKKGNYRGLIVYQKAECIYDITFYFAHHFFVERKDRTIDQSAESPSSRTGGRLAAERRRAMRRRMGLMRPMRRLIGLIGLMGLMSCGGGDDATVQTPPTPPSPPTPTTTETAISFSGAESLEQAVSNGGNRANGANGANEANRRAAGTPLSEKATTFHVWGYKNMSYDNGTGNYGGTQEVIPGYRVDWSANSAATTTTNSKGWEYVGIADQTIKYWDWGAAAYRYFAVTGESTAYEAYGAYKDNEANKPYEFSMLVDASPVLDDESKYKKDATDEKLALAPYFSKLWFSTGNQATYPDKQFGKPVTLEFLKPYARVRFLYKYSTPRQGFKLTEQQFRPRSDVEAEEANKVKIARKGTVTVHYPTEGPEIKEWYSVAVDADKSTRLTAFTEDYDPDDDTKVYTTCDNGWYWVLPIISQDSYTLTVKVNNSGRSVTVPAQYMQWLPGYSYTYIFKVTEEGGVEIGWVEYAMTRWTDMIVDKSAYNW